MNKKENGSWKKGRNKPINDYMGWIRYPCCPNEHPTLATTPQGEALQEAGGKARMKPGPPDPQESGAYKGGPKGGSVLGLPPQCSLVAAAPGFSCPDAIFSPPSSLAPVHPAHISNHTLFLGSLSQSSCDTTTVPHHQGLSETRKHQCERIHGYPSLCDCGFTVIHHVASE